MHVYFYVETAEKTMLYLFIMYSILSDNKKFILTENHLTQPDANYLFKLFQNNDQITLPISDVMCSFIIDHLRGHNIMINEHLVSDEYLVRGLHAECSRYKITSLYQKLDALINKNESSSATKHSNNILTILLFGSSLLGVHFKRFGIDKYVDCLIDMVSNKDPEFVSALDSIKYWSNGRTNGLYDAVSRASTVYLTKYLKNDSPPNNDESKNEGELINSLCKSENPVCTEKPDSQSKNTARVDTFDAFRPLAPPSNLHYGQGPDVHNFISQDTLLNITQKTPKETEYKQELLKTQEEFENNRTKLIKIYDNMDQTITDINEELELDLGLDEQHMPLLDNLIPEQKQFTPKIISASNVIPSQSDTHDLNIPRTLPVQSPLQSSTRESKTTDSKSEEFLRSLKNVINKRNTRHPSPAETLLQTTFKVKKPIRYNNDSDSDSGSDEELITRLRATEDADSVKLSRHKKVTKKN